MTIRKAVLAVLAAGWCLVGDAPAAVLTLTIDRNTGEAWIENLSDESIPFDAYDVSDEDDRLDPDGWRSFGDFIAEDLLAAQAALGSLAWSELFASTDSLVDSNFNDATTADPGFRVSIGMPFAEVFEDMLEFSFNDTRLDPGDKGFDSIVDGDIRFIGEVAFPWLNAANANDVNDNGAVTPQDVIILVNSINDQGSRILDAPTAGNEPPPYLDPSGDNQISPSDVISVVNAINAANSPAAVVPEPGAAGLAASTLGVWALATAWATNRRRRRLAD